MDQEACCTCAALLSSIPPHYDEKSEKPAVHERRLDCCDRAICARCMSDNPRFESYCPFCQISTQPSVLPQGLRDPPAYSPPPEQSVLDDEPPPYQASHPRCDTPQEKPISGSEDVLHFVDPARDTVNILAVRYGVPANALRKTNGLYSDHLLAARRTILIPSEYYKGGISLSPRPIAGEEEELRKGKLRKFMMACKVSDYDIAELYLEQAAYDLDAAVYEFHEDEKWEKEHPIAAAKRKANSSTPSRRRQNRIASGLAGQLG